MAHITELLDAVRDGQPQAAEKLVPLVYNELRRLARSRLREEAPDHTLQPTALVHEAYLRLIGAEDKPQWESRRHFFAAAAEAMRRILVESARRKRRLKRGGDLKRQPLDENAIAAPEEDGNLLLLDAALEALAAKDPRKAELVKLRYFAGLTMEQAAQALDISTSTADRDWAYARAWLFRQMSKGVPPVEG